MLPFQKKLSNSFFAMLSLPATAMGFGLAVQIAVLSWLLDTKYGLDTMDIGLVWAMGPLGGLIGQVVIGIISDKVWVWNGRRRAFIWIGGVLAAMGLLSLPNIGIIQASLGIDGILGVAIVVSLTIDLAINVSFNPTRAIIADVTPEGRPRTKGYTWMQTISGSFGVLAYLIGAIWGNYVLIYFGVILILLFSIIPPFFIKEPRHLGHYGKDDEAAGEADRAAKAKGGIKDATLVEIAKTIMPLWGFLLYALYGIFSRIGLIEIVLDFSYRVSGRLGFIQTIWDFLYRVSGRVVFIQTIWDYLKEILLGSGLMHVMKNYGFEICCLLLTIVVVVYTMSKKELGISKERDGMIGFRKILAAHSFTWIGIQTMFIYMFAFVQFSIPELADVGLDPALYIDDAAFAEATKDAVDASVGRIVNWSLFSFNLVAAIIPVFILEPMAARFGRVRTHAFCIAIMSVGALNIFFFGTSPEIIYGLMAIVGIGWAATISLPFAIMSQKIPQNRMGFYMGLFNLSVTLPMFVSSFGMAAIVEAVENKGTIFILLAVTAAISAILWAFVKEPRDVFTENPVMAEQE